jgi:hypothetical protein
MTIVTAKTKAARAENNHTVSLAARGASRSRPAMVSVMFIVSFLLSFFLPFVNSGGFLVAAGGGAPWPVVMRIEASPW